MVTKGILPVNISKEAAYDALLAACEDMGAKVKYADRESFVVDGESGTMWLQNRFSFRFYARVRAQYDGALLEVYDFSPKREDKRFLGKLFEKMKKRASVGEPDYKDVDSIEPESNQGPRHAYLPARPVQPQPAHGVQPPLLMVEGGRIKGREYSVKIEGSGEEAIADRMTIVPIEAGNLIRLTKGDFLVREIPIGTVESIDAISESEKRLLGDRDDNRKIILSYSDGVSHSLTIDVDDGKAGEIVQEVNTLKDIEAEYFKASEFEYREGDRWVRSRFYVQAPFLAQGEKVLWKEEDMAGFISKRYKWVKAVTNIRALHYEFDTHKSTFITLPIIEDVVVTDKRIESSSQHQAMAYTFRPGSGPYSYSNVQGNTQTTSVTIGDVLIMYGGRPVIRLNSVEDPDGVAALVRAAVKESRENLREVAGPHAEESRPTNPACPSCGSHNSAGARFCNQCGSQI